MKKILMTLVLVFSLVMLCSCSKVNQKYADKVNAAAENKEHYTYQQVLDDLGDEAIDMTAYGTGLIVAVKGVESEEDLESKITEKEEIKGILIAVLGKKAIKAYYGEITEETINNFYNLFD